MSITNKALLAQIQQFGLDEVINNTDPDQVADDLIRIMVRTAQSSKSILLSSLEEFVANEEQKGSQIK